MKRQRWEQAIARRRDAHDGDAAALAVLDELEREHRRLLAWRPKVGDRCVVDGEGPGRVALLTPDEDGAIVSVELDEGRVLATDADDCWPADDLSPATGPTDAESPGPHALGSRTQPIPALEEP